jgi:hypothetical protein
VTVRDYLPDRLDLGPPRRKLVGLICISLALAGAGALALAAGQSWGWAPLILFALSALAFAMMLLDSVGLRLDREGFAIRTLWRDKRRAWTQVSEFTILDVQGARMIMFDDFTKQGPLLANANRIILGRGEAIPAAVVRGRMEDVCDTLNEFRNRALAQQQQQQ